MVSATSPNIKNTRPLQEYSDILSSLHLALKNIQLYPPGHALLQARLADAHQALARVLAQKKHLFFGIAKNAFTYAGSLIGENSSSCAAFANILSRHEIASITFSKGISQHSLFLFLKAVSVLPDQQTTGGNIIQDISTLDIPHLKVEFIDYTNFTSTGNGDGRTTPLTWTIFAQKLTSGALVQSGEKEGAASRSKAITPTILATTINQQMGTHPIILKHFSDLLDQVLQQTPQQYAAASLGGQELSQTLSSLNPKLQQQFLSTTLKVCDKNLKTGNTEKLLDEFSASVVLDMLQQLNREQTTVSPALLNLIQKLSGMHFAAEELTPTSITRLQKTDNLLKQKNYAQQVSSSYQDSLQHLSQHSFAPSTPPIDFPLKEHLESMEDEQLNRKIIQAILIFMATPIQDQEYQQLARKLMELSLLLPDYGGFDLLQNIVRQLKQHIAKPTSAVQKSTAEKCIDELISPDFLDFIFSVLPNSSEEEKRNGIDFLLLLGEDALDSIIEVYCIKTKISAMDPMVEILKAARVQTLARVFKIMKNATSAHVLKLLLLVEYLGTQGTSPLLHPWLKHENSSIRDQVLNLLLPLHDQKATDTVLSMLKSGDESMVNTAMQLCNTYHLHACVPALIELLEHVLVTRSAIEKNRQLIQVLGHIGDPVALPHLEALAFGNWLLLRREIADMKRLIFYTLKNYPLNDCRLLLLKGSKSKDKKTVTICNSILQSHERTSRKK